jgi:membrane associated rhomboid family serine protease
MTVLLFILSLTIGISWFVQDKPEIKNKLILRPYLVWKKGQVYRLLTHGFVHADFTHLAFNMFVLWQFGSLVEYQFQEGQFSSWFPIGQPSFLTLYIGGVIAAAAPAVAKHLNNSNYASLGASGGVSAVMMAYILLFPTQKLFLFFVIPMPAFVAGILFFAYEHYMKKKGGTGIAHDAHLMGAIFGCLFILIHDLETIPRLAGAFELIISQ